MQPSSTELPSRGLYSRFFFQRRKKGAVYRPQAQGDTAEYCDLVSSSRGNAQTADKERKTVLKNITCALSCHDQVP